MSIVHTSKFVCAECKTELEGFEYQHTGVIEFKECPECASVRDEFLEESMNNIFNEGRDEGYIDGQEDGRADGYEEGYEEGLDACKEKGSE